MTTAGSSPSRRRAGSDRGGHQRGGRPGAVHRDFRNSRKGVVQVWWIVGLCAALAGVSGLWLWSWHRWRDRLAGERAERAVQAFTADVERAEAQRALVWVAAFARDALADRQDDLEAEREGVDWLLWGAEMDDTGESE